MKSGYENEENGSVMKISKIKRQSAEENEEERRRRPKEKIMKMKKSVSAKESGK